MERPKGLALCCVLVLVAGLLALHATTAAQAPGKEPPSLPTRTEQRKWYMLGRVTTLAGLPVPAAEVAVYLDARATPVQQLDTSFQGEFEISLDADSGTSHRVRVVATKQGYLNATEAVDLSFDRKTDVIDLVLRENQQDADQLSVATLISSVAERLRTTAPERSDTVRAAQASLEAHDADGALRLLAKALEREPNCVEFRTLRGLAMLQAGSWSSGMRQLTETALLNASLEAKSQRPEPGLILGVVECWRGNPQKATEFLLQALNAEPGSGLLLQEIGRARLFQRNWSEADAYLARAIRAGASPEAHLLRAQALLGEAKPSDAQDEMRTFLGGRKPKDFSMPIRLWWIKLNDRMELEVEAAAAPGKLVVKQTTAELLQAMPELNGLEPAQGQEELPSILHNAGDRAEAFFRDFHNTSSREEIRMEHLRRDGKSGSSYKQNFQYLLLAWPDSSRPALDEYRTDPKGASDSPYIREEGFMLTKGFASASQYLLPAYQEESTFAYLGRQRMDGHETDVVAFAQQPGVARLPVVFRAGATVTLTLCQGVAWIDRSTHQIVRMRTDLLSPAAKVRLDRETTEIHYGEVRFQDVPFSSWLPRDVVVTVEWKGKLLRNRHIYSDFHLFNVESKIITTPEPGP